MKGTHRWTQWTVVLGLALVLTSCYPGEVSNTAELDTVITSFDDTYNFQKNLTYAMPDTVIHLFGEDDPNEDLLTREHDAEIIARVHRNMKDLGYQEITDPDTTSNRPDVVVVIQATASKTHVIGTYPPGWGWGGWWPGYPCCWGGGYPGYWYRGSYATGTLYIDMFDTDKYLAQEDVSITWEGLINGLLAGSSLSTSARLNETIDQAFMQSPYLKLKGGSQ